MVFSFDFFDLLSPDITLYYKGKLTHSSKISGIISIISIIITLIFSYIFLLDLKRRNPSAFYYNRFVKDIISRPLNSSGLFHLINVTSGNIPYEINRLFTIIGINKLIYLFDFNNIESFDHYIYEYCEEIDIKGIENIILDNTYDFNKLFCLKKYYNKTTQKIYNLNNNEYPYPQIINSSNNPYPTIYGIVVKKCKNSTILNNNNCYSNEIIEESLKYLVGYSIDFLDHNILIDNFENPNSDIYHSINNLYDFGVGYTINHLNFLPTMLRTNKGYILDYEISLNSYKFSFIEKITTLFSEEQNPNKDIYGGFYLWFLNQEDIYIRSYKKVQDILGSITGLARVLFLCAKMLNMLIHNFTYINDINNEMKIHYKFIISKPFSFENHPIKIKKDNIPLNNKIINNIDKSSFQINCESNNTDRINKYFKRLDNNNYFKVTFWRICKKFIFQKKDEFINKIIVFRKFIISEEIMFQYYYIIHSLKNPILEHNNILKDFGLFKEENLMINQSIYNSKENI